MSGRNSDVLSVRMLAPGELPYRVDRARDGRVLAWCGTLDQASSLVAHGLACDARVVVVSPTEYRRRWRRET